MTVTPTAEILRPIHTENDRNIIEDGRLAQLRKEALRVIQNSGDAEKLSEILREVDNPRLLDPKSNDKDFPDSLLEWSVREGSVDCVRLLLSTGADPTHSQLGGGFLPVHLLACAGKNFGRQTIGGIAQALSEAGADFNARDASGWTPLHHAVYSGSPWVAEFLISRGVEVDPRLVDDPEVRAKVIPDEREDDHPFAVEALAVVQRVVRSGQLHDAILSAMPDEGEPAPKSSPAMTL